LGPALVTQMPNKRPTTAQEWEALLASEGMPAELEPLPSFLTAAPRRDGKIPLHQHLGDDPDGPPSPRNPATAERAARFLADKQATEEGVAELQQVLWSGLLTDAETKVFELYCEGVSERAIAKQTGLTYETVRWRLGRIYKRFGLRFRFGNESLTPHRASK
jgi:hypothetical protein